MLPTPPLLMSRTRIEKKDTYQPPTTTSENKDCLRLAKFTLKMPQILLLHYTTSHQKYLPISAKETFYPQPEIKQWKLIYNKKLNYYCISSSFLAPLDGLQM